MLTVLDEHTRECHVLGADRALKSGDVLKLVSAAITLHGAPEYIRSDNGSEFIAHIIQDPANGQRVSPPVAVELMRHSDMKLTGRLHRRGPTAHRPGNHPAAVVSAPRP